MQAKGTAEEWGVKFIKKRREDEHGNIEFLVEWDGDWAETWEPQVNLENAQDKIDAFVASGSRGAPQVPRCYRGVVTAQTASRLLGGRRHH